jgi:hypothetical protein
MKATTISTLLLLLAPFLVFPWQARATLGEGSDSVTRDSRALAATKKAPTSRAGYSIQEVSSDATTVREYLNPSGVVFAVAWRGFVHPDLDTLLGSYASEYGSAKRQTPRTYGLKRSKVETGRVIVETWGHMRDLRGRAYLPALLPKGVSVDEIN